METTLIIGPPGTGKTTRLMDILEKELASGIEPNKVAFCSFTKKAVEEAIERACNRFNFKSADLIYFRTIHSLAFRMSGIRKNQVMNKKDYKIIGDHLGITFTGRDNWTEDFAPVSKNPGDQYLFIDSFSRARCLPCKHVWDTVSRDNLNWYEFLRFCDTLQEYKRTKFLVDFADMIDIDPGKTEIEVLIIDEAQDLSTAQWYFISKAFNPKRVYIGGDDDQAIFEWSGADVQKFITTQGHREVLHQSYRVPSSVHNVATEISSRINYRAQKQYKSRPSAGSVEYWNDLTHVDLSAGSWLLLARNGYLLNELVSVTKDQGYMYNLKGKSTLVKRDVEAIQIWEAHRNGMFLTPEHYEVLNNYMSAFDHQKIWHQAFDKMPTESSEYYISLLRKGESLTKTPRINISTIHGSKGGEADNVLLVTDMAWSTWESSQILPDSEHRVWYVGATRAKENLHIILPRGRYNYQL